jgi:hypothetical protein
MFFGFSIYEINIMKLITDTCCWKTEESRWLKGTCQIVIQSDLQTPTAKEEIHNYSFQYSARLSAHPNSLELSLMEQPDNKR